LAHNVLLYCFAPSPAVRERVGVRAPRGRPTPPPSALHCPPTAQAVSVGSVAPAQSLLYNGRAVPARIEISNASVPQSCRHCTLGDVEATGRTPSSGPHTWGDRGRSLTRPLHIKRRLSS
jgi:hypothetical protein